MNEINDIEDYGEKWLEAERELASNWIEDLYVPVSYEPVDQEDKNVEPVELPIVQLS